MSDNETQPQQPPAEWPFAPAYKDRFGALPGSQQREAIKRLTMRARNPLTSEKLVEESPDVEACLSALFTAYTSKKERARLASASKRASEREAKKAAAAAGTPEPGPSATAAAVVEAEGPSPADLAKSISDLALEPASVVCEPAPGPAKAGPVVLPPGSQPIPLPALAQSSKPVQKAAPVARGLNAMLKRS